MEASKAEAAVACKTRRRPHARARSADQVTVNLITASQSLMQLTWCAILTIVAGQHDVRVLTQQRAAVNVVKDLQQAQHSTPTSVVSQSCSDYGCMCSTTVGCAMYRPALSQAHPAAGS
jgi:hypothetical protein